MTQHAECYYQQEIHGFIYRIDLAKIIIDKIVALMVW